MPTPPLADRLGHAFVRPALLAQALTHRSHSASHNERLEFVGDAVLNCVVGLILYERHPDIPEGDLSRVRANLVNGEVLARLAAALDLAAVLKLGEGELRAGAARPSILADALEAVFGAVFVDGGFAAARTVIERVYGDELARLDPAAWRKDPKTELQEWLQARRLPVPSYVVVEVTGEAHAQTFHVECRIPAFAVVAAGEGASRRAAEQAAAAAALAGLPAGAAA
jgi:ribonuclease-3